MTEHVVVGSAWAFWVAVVSLIGLLLTADNKRKRERYPWIYILFFFSGFSALLYQIVWQRALFDIYGVNIESVTVVVTAFMLGLGLGSLLGGQLSRQMRLPLLALFGTLELAIAVFGVFSLRLFHWVASFTAGASLLTTSLVAFVVVLIPTLLMGSTLPLLVTQMVKVTENVGRSVGKLYFVNTLGSAVACFFAVVAMPALGQSGSVLLAAAINTCVGGSVIVFSLSSSRSRLKAGIELTTGQPAEPSGAVPVPFPLAAAIAALAGLIALGYEILWYRIFSFVTGGMARSFAELLGSYLAGIALGSLAVEAICRNCSRRNSRKWLGLVGQFVIAANVIGFFVIPFLSWTSRWLAYQYSLPLVVIAAAALGAAFPLIAHAAIPPDSRSGARLSYLYLSNILGSAAGSFIVGFILMDHWTLRQIALALALAGVATGAALLARAFVGRKLVPAMAGCAGLALMLIFLTNPLFDRTYEKLYFKSTWKPPDGWSTQHFHDVIETRSGVVAVSDGGRQGSNLVLGDGSLEARLTTDLRIGGAQNFLIPPYAISALHPSPKQILMIGLGCGSWAQVIANNPQVEKVTIVEINPGYLQLISRYPEVASLLSNPKIEIIINDGRRWLIHNEHKRFDFVVMNAPMHDRNHVSALLSVEFDQLVRRVLKPGGVFLYNSTFSSRALLTGATVFPYAVRLRNCLAGSDSPIVVDKDRWRQILLSYRMNGQPLFNAASSQDRARLEQLLSLADSVGSTDRWDAMEKAESLRQRFSGLRLITDDNMGDEWGGSEWF